jgi:Flp pilus assembly protein protease CpaA
MTQSLLARASKACAERSRSTLLPITIAVCALSLVFPNALPVPFPIAFVGMNALFIWISINDFKTRSVPNMVTYPLMAVGIVRAISFRDGIFLVYWVVFFALWTAHFMGGGDAKLLMGLFGLFPEFQLAWLVGASILVTGLPYLAYKYRRQWRTIPRAFFWRLITRQFLPNQAEFEKEAVPYAFSFCLAGVVYVLTRSVRL